ncbi:MAG: hypothetical protein OQL19_18470 [Gammaproteobacteria bacterium]|nr:hypothetical protein [Gammaproteobacteria bacterium]
MAKYPDAQRLADAGRYYTPTGKIVSIVDEVGGLVVIDEVISNIHSGFAFGIDASGTLAASSSLVLLGDVGDKEVHFNQIDGNFSQGNIRITLYEAPTITANGTPLTPYALNRANIQANTIQVYSAPTVTANGTSIGSKFLPLSGGGANTQPVNGSIANSRVLKRNTKYLMVITNETTNDTVDFGVNIVWTEPVNQLG